MSTDEAPPLTLEAADPQDLADILAALTVVGHYASDAGLDESKERIRSLRKRLVLENREHAEALVVMDELGLVAVDDADLMIGVRNIIRGDDAGHGED